MRHWRTPEALPLPIAEAMGDLICRKDFTLVRKCGGPTCTLWFHDVSKGHARRWSQHAGVRQPRKGVRTSGPVAAANCIRLAPSPTAHIAALLDRIGI